MIQAAYGCKHLLTGFLDFEKHGVELSICASRDWLDEPGSWGNACKCCNHALPVCLSRHGKNEKNCTFLLVSNFVGFVLPQHTALPMLIKRFCQLSCFIRILEALVCLA